MASSVPQTPSLPSPVPLAHISLDKSQISDLESVKTKLVQLNKNLDFFLQYLNNTPSSSFTYSELLNKFSLATAKFLSLNQELVGEGKFTGGGDENNQKIDTVFSKLSLHPWFPTVSESENIVLTTMLRTKVIPEVEKSAEELVKEIEEEMNSKDVDLENEVVVKAELEKWKTFVELHDRVAKAAGDIVSNVVDKRELFEVRGTTKPEIEDQNAPAKEQAEWQTLGFPTEEKWRQWQLECIAVYISSGKSELVDSELTKGIPKFARIKRE